MKLKEGSPDLEADLPAELTKQLLLETNFLTVQVYQELAG